MGDDDEEHEDERVYIVSWADDVGDHYMYFTGNLERADAKLSEAYEKYTDVGVNFRWRDETPLRKTARRADRPN